MNSNAFPATDPGLPDSNASSAAAPTWLSYEALKTDMCHVASLVALATGILIHEVPPASTPSEERALEKLTALLWMLREQTQTIASRLEAE